MIMLPKRLTFRMSIRSLLVLIALFAVIMAAWTLYRDPVRQWSNAIHEDNDGPRRYRAISEAIQGISPGIDQPTATRLLADALFDPSVRVRQTAAQFMSRFGAESRRAVPALIKVLGDQDSTVRAYAAKALGEISIDAADPARAEVVSALTHALHDRNKFVRLSAAVALAYQGAGTVALPTLIDALGPRDVMDRFAAIEGIHAIGAPVARAAIPALIAMADDSAHQSNGDGPLMLGRVYAAEALHQLGERESALEILRDAASSDNIIVRDEARVVRLRLEPSSGTTAD